MKLLLYSLICLLVVSCADQSMGTTKERIESDKIQDTVKNTALPPTALPPTALPPTPIPFESLTSEEAQDVLQETFWNRLNVLGSHKYVSQDDGPSKAIPVSYAEELTELFETGVAC